MDFLIRIASLVRKELLAVLRDKKSRLALIIPPIIQIAIFGYAATMNVTRVPYAVLDKDGGEAAAQYIADLEGTGIFRRQAAAATEKDIDRMIDNREIVVGLTIPPDFSRSIQTGRPASLQLIADGRNTNTAAIALSYGQQIAAAYGADLLSKNGGSSPVETESRAWFNPNLITRWFIVPGLIAVLVLINSILSGALSIAREREEGTFDQLLVAPYTPGEILLGKGTASVVTGIMQAVFVVLVAMFWFRIPFQGSIWLLSAALLLKKREDIGLIALANLMTNPAVVYLSLLTKALRPGLYPAAAAVTELLAVLAEGYAYKRRAAKIARPMLFSLCMNALSFGTGLVIKLIF